MLLNNARRAAVAVGAVTAMVTMVGNAAGATTTTSPTSGVHTSEWASAQFNMHDRRNTEIIISIGDDSPVGSARTRSVEVDVTQSYCKKSTLVTVSMSNRSFVGAGDIRVSTTRGRATIDDDVALTGTVTETPAGKGCTAPVPASAVTTSKSAKFEATARWRATGSPLLYSDDKPANYSYSDAMAKGEFTIRGLGVDDYVTAEAGAWIWQGLYTVTAGLPYPEVTPAT